MWSQIYIYLKWCNATNFSGKVILKLSHSTKSKICISFFVSVILDSALCERAEYINFCSNWLCSSTILRLTTSIYLDFCRFFLLWLKNFYHPFLIHPECVFYLDTFFLIVIMCFILQFVHFSPTHCIVLTHPYIFEKMT